MTKKKILIVDDNISSNITLSNIIREWGIYIVDIANNGQQALDKVFSDSPPDLILLDIMMPKIHGYNVCQQIRAEQRFKNVKILMTSAKTYKSDIDQALALGADGYMLKPYDFDVLKEKIDAMLWEDAESMKIKIWGARGSIPTPGNKYDRYGGNTSCVELRIGKKLLIFDAGTGIRELGIALNEEYGDRPIEGRVFITHAHWDHIQGFPFFTPVYIAANKFEVYGPMGADRNIEKIICGQHDLNYFPVSIADLLAKINFIDLTGEDVRIDDINISYMYLNHPGMTIGYKIECSEKTIIYATDNELDPDVGSSEKKDYLMILSEFVKDADILITDAQYSDEEYKLKKGWGHSPINTVLDFAMNAGVKKLVFFHHDPMHTDEQLDELVDGAAKKAVDSGSGIDCLAAREKETIKI
ncbi:MAG: response regulator [Elusimicrobiota bacterium]